MKTFKILSLLTLIALLLPVANAKVARPAPDFLFSGESGRISGLKSLRGQPVVLIVATSPHDHAFRRQVKNAKELFRRFAARETLFVAAFTRESGDVISDIPFLIANNGGQVADAYRSVGGVSKSAFGVFIIGPDGNLDIATAKVLSAERMKEILDNNYVVQAAQRK